MKSTNALPMLIRLWHFNLDEDDHDDALSLLSDDERIRADRLKSPLIRRRFISGRVRLRRILAAQLQADPAALIFRYSHTGKPYLADLPLHFNFSHSEHLALLVVAKAPVGVDIERRRSAAALQAMEATIFTTDELNFLRQFSSAEREIVFFRLWTCKEALIKATGEGFQAIAHYQIRWESPTGYSVALDAQGNTIPWLIRSFDVDDSYSAAAAIATEGTPMAEITLDLRAGNEAFP